MPILPFIKVLELSRKNRIAPVYLLIGPEDICKEKAKELYSHISKEGTLIESYDLNDKEDKRSFAKIRGYQEGLFGIKKIFLIYGAENLERQKEEEIIQTIEKGSPFTWFIMANKFEDMRPLYKFVLERGAIIHLDTKKEEDLLAAELFLRLKEANKTMDKTTADLFLSLVGKDYHHFLNELQKLLIYTHEKEVISEEDIWSVVVSVEESLLFLIEDAMFNASPERSFKLVANLLDHKEEPTKILGYLYRFLKTLQILAEFLEKHPELKDEVKFTQFAKKWQEIKENPIEEIPKPLAEIKHPYRIFNMKKNIHKIKDFKNIFENVYKAELGLKKEFRNPYQVFKDLFLNLWKELR